MVGADKSERVTDEGCRFLTFRVDGRLYALPAEDVTEVIRAPRFARIPQAPKSLLGVANLRGTVLPLINLHDLLRLPGSGTESTRAIVLSGAARAALTVDSVEALVIVPSTRVETRPAAIAAEFGEKATGMFQAEGLEAAKILNADSLLANDFAPRAEKEPRISTRAIPLAAREIAVAPVERDLLITFDVANQEYALALSAVQEVVRAPESVTLVPRAETPAVGMMAFRDGVLPLLSLRGLLGLEQAAVREGRGQVVVTSVGGYVVGLVADRARAIISAERSLIEPISPVLAARTAGEARIKAIYRGENGNRLVSVIAPDQLFREDVMQRLGTRQEAPSPKTAEPASAERQFLIFRLGDDEFGLPAEAVDEVSHVPELITRVPKTPKFLEGLVNLRGEVLPVVDQRRRFDMPAAARTKSRRLIVLRSERHRAGIIVDSVSEVLRSPTDAIAPPPELTGDITRLVHGVISVAGRLILLLNPSELLTRAERGLLDSFERKSKASL